MRKFCGREACRKRIAFLGDCKFCGQGFCIFHFQPENHSCSKISECRISAFEKNKNFLNACAYSSPKIRT
uniref:Ubiquitin-like protein n=1 Tax=Marseillevirus sp. TaxID=2809551 RepID=A0AA96ELX6_9VIRU|nr:ubiquitin-like protein [Marseillevirus sp.]